MNLWHFVEDLAMERFGSLPQKASGCPDCTDPGAGDPWPNS